MRRSEYLGEEISQVSCRCSGKEKPVGGKNVLQENSIAGKNEIYS